MSRPRAIVLGILFIIYGCESGVETHAEPIPATAAGVALAKRLEGTWIIASTQRSSCPKELVTNPFAGSSRWWADGHALHIEATNSSAPSLLLYGVDDHHLEHRVTASGQGCEFTETHLMTITRLDGLSASGEYTQTFTWEGGSPCDAFVSDYADGLSTPCELSVSWVGQRL